MNEDRNCGNCYYEGLGASEYPCSRCIRNEPSQDQWRAKEPATAFYIDVPAFRKLPKTIKDPRIKPDMGVTARLSNPLAQVGNWIAETEEGFLVLSGCIRGTTAARLKVGYGVGGLWELLSEDF